MRALVTGSAGFVGRHMVAELERRGYTTVGAFDLVNGDDCRKLFRDDGHWVAGRYDLVVHCAFHVGGRAAIDGEPRLLARNLELDALLFEWAARTGQGRVLYFSSSAAYPTHFQTGEDAYALAEDDIHLADVVSGTPDARYGWAKLTGEHLAAAARLSGVPVTVVRPFSGYGEDQAAAEYPFPAIVERARLKSDPFEVWGPGTQVRDWIHVSDVVAGALAVAESGTTDPVNLCTGVGTSMLELAALCCAEVGYEPVFRPLPDKPTGVQYRVGDPARFHEIYKPQVSLAEGVQRALSVGGNS